jgi:diguanylate cyclase (GGDEF)-like protein
MLVNLALAWKPIPGVAPATHWLFAGSLTASATVFLSRAVAAIVHPETVEGFVTPSLFQSVGLLVGYTVTLTSSVAFLLMQKERADFRAQQLASIDPLTGAYNRRTFMELAEKELSRARRFDSPLSLIILDLDHFKRVNDTYGHLAGDGALKAFADIVRAEMRKEDIFVRYGGEEFCLLLPDVPGTGAVALAGRIRKAIEKEPLNIGGHQISLTTSAGVAARIDENPEDLDRLIARADEALYLAKNRGRNRVAAVSLGQSKLA